MIIFIFCTAVVFPDIADELCFHLVIWLPCHRHSHSPFWKLRFADIYLWCWEASFLKLSVLQYKLANFLLGLLTLVTWGFVCSFHLPHMSTLRTLDTSSHSTNYPFFFFTYCYVLEIIYRISHFLLSLSSLVHILKHLLNNILVKINIWVPPIMFNVYLSIYYVLS